MSSKEHYNRFALHYDQVVGDRLPVAKYLRRLIKAYHQRAKTILELGCGSGTMLSFLEKTYTCTGIDSSTRMLSIARKKAPNSVILEGDITKLSLKERFDVIICPFDTMNHIISFADWKRVFAGAHKHLRPEGIFIFDVNTEEKMERYRLEPVTADVSDDSISFVEVSRERKYRYTVHLTLLRRYRGDSFKRYDMSLPELIVPTEKIVDNLSEYFRSVILIDPDRDTPDEDTTELFFVCRDPR